MSPRCFPLLSLSPSFVLPVGVLTTVVVAVGRPLEELLLTLIHLIRSLSPFIRILFLFSGSLSVGNGAYKINRCYPDCSPVETRQAQEGTDSSSLSLSFLFCFFVASSGSSSAPAQGDNERHRIKWGNQIQPDDASLQVGLEKNGLVRASDSGRYGTSRSRRESRRSAEGTSALNMSLHLSPSL